MIKLFMTIFELWGDIALAIALIFISLVLLLIIAYEICLFVNFFRTIYKRLHKTKRVKTNKKEARVFIQPDNKSISE